MDGSIQQENQGNLDNNSTITNAGGNNSKFQTGIIILLIIIIFLLLALISYLFFFQQNKTTGNVIKKTSTNNTSSTKTISNPYLNWSVYTNSTFGYSFKYPSSWSLYTSNYPNNVGGDISANSQTGGEVELVKNSGANIIFSYNLTGIGGSIQLISKIEKFNINNTQYDLVFLASYSQSSCPQEFKTPPITIPTSLLPQSCTQYTNRVYLVSNLSQNIENIHGNYFTQPLMNTHISDPTINSNTVNALGSLYLNLPSAINIDSINTNSDIQVFENLLKSLQLP